MFRILWIVSLLWLGQTAFAAAVNPPGTLDLSVALTESGKPGGKPVPDLFQRERDDKDCAKCPPMTVAAACAGVLRLWTPGDEAQFTSGPPGAGGSHPDDAAITGQKRAREKLAEKIENAPQGVELSAHEIDVLTNLLGRLLNAQSLSQALSIINPNATVPDLK